jgi:hypothetical protein
VKTFSLKFTRRDPVLVLGTLLLMSTSFIIRPFPTVIKETKNIARGKVGISYSDWSFANDGTKRLYTFTELIVEEVIKGALRGPSIMMREFGGTKDGVGMEVSGTASFKKGEEIVVMLGEENVDGSYQVMGLMLGKLEVHRSNGRVSIKGPALKEETWPLDKLKTTIASHGDTPGTIARKKIETDSSPFPTQGPKTSPLVQAPVKVTESTADPEITQIEGESVEPVEIEELETSEPKKKKPTPVFLIAILFAMTVFTVVRFRRKFKKPKD